MTTVKASEARARFGVLLARVAMGENVQITKNGRPIARLVPEQAHDPDRAARAAERLKAFHEGQQAVSLSELLHSRHEGHRF